MEGWVLLLYLVLIGIVLYLFYKLVYHLTLSDDYYRTLGYLRIEKESTSINGFFGSYPIYYINLDRSTDRLKYLQRQMEKYDIKATRISAVDGKNITISYTITGYNKYTNSELACTLSHIKAISSSYDNGDQIAVILEDDTGFGLLSQSTQSLQQIIDHAPPDWEYLNLCPLNPIVNTINLGLYISEKKINGFGTSAYVINRKGMEKILSKIGDNNIDYNICRTPHLFSDALLPGLVNAYSYQPKLFYQNKTFPKEIEFSYAP